MQFQRFDLNLLVALDMLLREKNITRAAEKVFVSQPAMSAALHRLRDYFDDPLLVRVGRDMELSPRGQSLIEPVREALLLIQNALGSQPTFCASTTRRAFRLVMSEEAITDVLPAVLAGVAAEAPGVCVNTEFLSMASLSHLESGDVDLCFAMDSLPLFDMRAFPESLRSMPLRPVRWVCAVDVHHPSVRDGITREQYVSLPHVIGRPHGSAVQVEQFVRRMLDVDINIHVTVPSLLHLPYALAGTRLIATLPERIARRFVAHGSIKTFPLPIPMADMNEMLFWHKRNDSDPAHAWLRDLIIRVTLETAVLTYPKAVTA
jgi:DNA-binding transcriptional LysR family regulator